MIGLMVDLVICGDCVRVLPTLEDGSVDCCVTSPPYAQQRRRQYGGVSEEEYPEWTVKWMGSLRPKLSPDASVLIVIRSHVSGGQVSDYVMRTRLALRDEGWKECEELIWLKPDAPPLGSVRRPRRTWESVLWFSGTSRPYVDLLACGNRRGLLGFGGSGRFGFGGDSPIHDGQDRRRRRGASRVSDVFKAYVGGIERGVPHPAMFPQSLSDSLVLTFSREGVLVLDPFCGSGTVGVSALSNRRRFLGVEVDEGYARISMDRLRGVIPYIF